MINLILSDTNRSLFYIKELIKNKIEIKKIILYSEHYGNVYKYIKKKKLDKILIFCKTKSVDSSNINKNLNRAKSEINIISTYPGEIVKNSSLLKKNLVHFHAGDLPEFKGSSTIYFTILQKKKICVTVFLMNKYIDKGKILYKKYFNYPKNLLSIEKSFDDKIRAQTLIAFLKFKNNYKYSKIKDRYLPYYIAHPIIRNMVIKKKFK